MSKGLALRPSVPDLAAVVRSLVCVAAAAAVAVTVGPHGSVTAVVGAAAIAGATAVQDSPRGRVPLVVAVSVMSGLAVLLGAATSAISVLLVVVAAVWSFGTAMGWALGASAGLVGAASTALMVSAAPVPPTWTSALGTAALAVGAGLAQAAVVALWPPRRWRAQRDALVGAYRSLAADARALAAGESRVVDSGPLIALREAFVVDEAHTRRRPATYRGWYVLPERLAGALTDLAGVARTDAVSRVLSEAADTLAAVADTSRSGRVGTDVAIGRFDAVAGETSGLESGPVLRLSTLLHEAVAMRLGDFVPSAPDAVRLRRPELRTSVRSAVVFTRGHLAWHSPVFRHAVRLAVAVAAGCAIERYAGGGQGYWIPLAVLLVLRPETAHTYTRCVGRVAGTVAGIVVACSVLLIVDPGVVASTVVAVVLIGVAFVAAGWGYIAMSAAVTVAVVFLVDAGRAGAAPVLSDPLLAALVGGALAVATHVLLPDDTLTRLSQRAGELLKTEIDYAATVIKSYVHESDSVADEVGAAWQRAFRARAAFEATTGAMRLETRELRHWLRCYRTGLNAVTSACITLEEHAPPRPAAGDREFVLAVDEYVEALCGDPPTPASPWSVDSVELVAAELRLHDAVARHGSGDAPARVLVAEVAAITRNLSAITVSPWPTVAR